MIKGAYAAAALAAALGATQTEARWLRADTDSFIIYSEGEERPLREFAERLQRFDTTLRILLDVDVAGEENRLPIYLLPAMSDVAKLADGRRTSSIAGFYVPHPDGSFAVSHRENDSGVRGTSASQQTLFHEYSHHFMKRYVTAAFPAWFIEGFAEYYSSVDFNKDGQAEIGRPVYRRAYGLLQMPKIPVETLFTKQPHAMRDGGEVDVYYGRSWLLTHMLYHDPGRAGQIGAYMRAINMGTDAKQAAADAFGDFKKLDADLNRYMTRSIAYRLTRDPVPVAKDIRIAALPPSEDALMPLRLERMSVRSDDAREAKVRDALKALSATRGDNADVWYEYAAAEWAVDDDKRDLAAVRGAVDRALAIKADHVRANVLLGELRAHDLDEKGEYGAAAWTAVRQPIQLANRTDPNDPVPLYAYFRSFIEQGKRPPDMAVKALERAFALAPENVGLRVSYAFALANRGEFDPAIKLAQSVAFDPHGGGRGASLLQQLEAMRRGEAAGDILVEEEEEEDGDAGAGTGEDLA